jgi:hypothetical protein
VNTSTQQGLDAFAATVHFLAERYNGTNPAQGKVDNWIMGNEVNDNLLYYYMGQQNAETFVQEYLQSFRVMYNAVKSAYANANVYICLEHQWNTADTAGDYGGKKFVDLFNAYATWIALVQTSSAAQWMILISGALWMAVAIYAFALQAIFENSPLRTVMNALRIAICNILKTVILLVIFGALEVVLMVVLTVLVKKRKGSAA